MAFRIGQKVVCVNDTPARISGIPNGLVKGTVYTVVATGLTNPIDPQKLPCIQVLELPSPHPLDRGYQILWAHRFRPVVERKTDTGMAILRKLLTDTKIKEKA